MFVLIPTMNISTFNCSFPQSVTISRLFSNLGIIPWFIINAYCSVFTRKTFLTISINTEIKLSHALSIVSSSRNCQLVDEKLTDLICQSHLNYTINNPFISYTMVIAKWQKNIRCKNTHDKVKACNNALIVPIYLFLYFM